MKNFNNLEQYYDCEYNRLLKSGMDFGSASLKADNYIVNKFGADTFDEWVKYLNENYEPDLNLGGGSYHM